MKNWGFFEICEIVGTGFHYSITFFFVNGCTIITAQILVWLKDFNSLIVLIVDDEGAPVLCQ